MLLPDKHILISESILGLAGLVLSHLSTGTTFDSLWRVVREQLDTPSWPANHDVQNFVLALCFLHSIGAVDVSANGELSKCV